MPNTETNRIENLELALGQIGEESSKWEDEWTPLAEDIAKDYESMAKLGKELHDEYLQ